MINTPLQTKNYEEYLRTRGYNLCKAEVIMAGPTIRNLNGVKFIYEIKKKCVSLEFKEISAFLAMDAASFIADDPYVQVSYVEINNIRIGQIPVQEGILKNLKDKNTVNFFLHSDKDIMYELGCIYYLEIPGYPSEYFMNKELDSWD